MASSPRIVLHIGIEKTGTTTIQTFFARNREAFRDHSVLYPDSLGDLNHLRLSAFADRRHICGDILPALRISETESLETLRSAYQRDLYSEIDSTPVDTLVLSNEHCHSRFQTLSEISRLKDVLAGISRRIQIVVYFRRQDRVASSFYSTQLKFGAARRRVFPDIKDCIPYYYDYYAIFNNWSRVYGRRNITVRRFDPKHFSGGSLLRDFMEAAGLDWSDDFFIPEQMNQSLKPEAQVFLGEFNKHVPQVVDNALNPRREGLIRIFDRHFSGAGTVPSRREAMDFYAHFVGSNHKLARELELGNSEELFDEDFSDYPEVQQADPRNYKDAVAIASVLWNEQSRELARLRAQNCYLRACLAERQNRPRKAIEYLETALEINPDYLMAVRMLASLLLKSSLPEKALTVLKSALASNPESRELEEQIRAVEDQLEP